MQRLTLLLISLSHLVRPAEELVQLSEVQCVSSGVRPAAHLPCKAKQAAQTAVRLKAVAAGTSFSPARGALKMMKLMISALSCSLPQAMKTLLLQRQNGID